MTQTRLLKTAGVITAFAAIILAGMMNNSRRVRARDDDGGDEREESRIRRGFEIRPCLNLEGRNPALVGLGSYIVNGLGDCNGCHSAGPQNEFAKGGNPYFLSPPFSGKPIVGGKGVCCDYFWVPVTPDPLVVRLPVTWN
jgi:hypothetical protein